MSAIALAAGVGSRTAVLAAAVLAGQLSVGWANDYVDAERDRLVGRRDKPIVTGQIGEGVVGAAAVVALVADVPLSLAVGWRAGAGHLVAVASAWSYNLRLKQTLASAVPYALSFGLLPVVVAAALPGSPRPQPLVVATAVLLGLAAHFANTVGDTADDAATGVRGLPQRIGPRGSLVAAATLLVGAAGCLVAATHAAVATLVAAAIALLALPAALRAASGRRTPFLAVIAAAGVLVVAFVAAGADHLTR